MRKKKDERGKKMGEKNVKEQEGVTCAVSFRGWGVGGIGQIVRGLWLWNSPMD
jgi:hypothetical protein